MLFGNILGAHSIELYGAKIPSVSTLAKHSKLQFVGQPELETHTARMGRKAFCSRVVTHLNCDWG